MYCAGKEGEYNGFSVMGTGSRLMNRTYANGVCVEVKIFKPDSCDLVSAIHAQVAKGSYGISGVADLLSTAT
jgi:hypothetical protein